MDSYPWHGHHGFHPIHVYPKPDFKSFIGVLKFSSKFFPFPSPYFPPPHVKSELMLLGLIAIYAFFSHESGLSEKVETLMAKAFPLRPDFPGEHGDVICSEESLNVLFEKVHLGISATMGIYFLTCMYLVLLHWIIYKHWIRIDYESFDIQTYDREMAAHRASHWLVRYLNVMRQLRLWRLHGVDRIHALRASCIEQYQLPSDFQFSKYFKIAMRDVVIHVLEVHPICWGILVLALLFTLARTFIHLRVNSSTWTIVIYGSLSLVVAILSLAIYLVASRIYRKVLALPSVRRHLHTTTAIGRSSRYNPNSLGVEPHMIVNEDETLASDFQDEQDAHVPLISHEHEEHWTTFSGRGRRSSDTAEEDTTLGFENRKDSNEPAFEHLDEHQPLHFQVFREQGDHLMLMSVDSYRKYQAKVTHILRRAQTPTTEDNEHKAMLLFRSKRFLVAALQVITFIQTWLTGLSIYFLYSIYVDQPPAPPKYPAIIIYVFIGPLITYGLMGPTLSKIVKATYTAGLVRPELVMEALFLPKSRHHPSASKTGAQRAYEDQKNGVASEGAMFVEPFSKHDGNGGNDGFNSNQGIHGNRNGSSTAFQDFDEDGGGHHDHLPSFDPALLKYDSIEAGGAFGSMGSNTSTKGASSLFNASKNPQAHYGPPNPNSNIFNNVSESSSASDGGVTSKQSQRHQHRSSSSRHSDEDDSSIISLETINPPSMMGESDSEAAE